MTTKSVSYALEFKLPGGRCLTVIGTEGAVFERRILLYDGQVFLDAHQAKAVVGLLDSMTEQAERLEQTIVPTAARTLPDGITDLNAERRRRAATVGAA